MRTTGDVVLHVLPRFSPAQAAFDRLFAALDGMLRLDLRNSQKLFVDPAVPRLRHRPTGLPDPAPYDRGAEWPGTVRPAVEVSERNGTIVVHSVLPGLDERGIGVLQHDGGPTIRAERSGMAVDRWREVALGVRRRFERYVMLPRGIDTDRAGARFRDGLLSVTLLKARAGGLKGKGAALKERMRAWWSRLRGWGGSGRG